VIDYMAQARAFEGTPAFKAFLDLLSHRIDSLKTDLVSINTEQFKEAQGSVRELLALRSQLTRQRLPNQPNSGYFGPIAR